MMYTTKCPLMLLLLRLTGTGTAAMTKPPQVSGVTRVTCNKHEHLMFPTLCFV